MYITNFNLSVTCIKSFMNMLKSNGPNIDPCGTLVVTSTKLELKLLYTSYCLIVLRGMGKGSCYGI